MSNKKILIVGDVYTDFHVDFSDNELRLGGVFHSARAFSALNTTYFLGVFCSDYQKNHITKWATTLKCSGICFLGTYTDKPNVMLVQDSYEIGNQEYRNILFDAKNIDYSLEYLNKFIDNNYITDVLIYPGDYNLSKVMDILIKIPIKIHIDIQYCSDLPQNVETVITSSSAVTSFNSYDQLVEIYSSRNIGGLLFKENRGGSRFHVYKDRKNFQAHAYRVDTEHSVGLGDVYNATILSCNNVSEYDLDFSSKVSALYASTMNHYKFIEKVDRLLSVGYDMIQYPLSPWELRKDIKIYLAAPDFPDLRTRKIADMIEGKLKHHNFTIFRPVIRNGLITDDTSIIARKIIFQKDIEHIYESDLCIAILDDADTGTAAEIGIFKSLNKPIIGYSSIEVKINNFVYQSLNVFCNSLVDLIEYTYIYGVKNG